VTSTDREPRYGPLVVISAVALTGPAVLAFFTGGYFDGPRVWAGLIAWALVVVAMLSSPSPLPARLGGRLALIGLGLLALWTLFSFTWAPIAGNAYHAGQRVILYAGALLAAAALLRRGAAQRAVEPVLALGTLVVVGYGLAGRLLPGLLHFSRSVSAQGRLEQPLTYWNAMGEVAALGLVLAVRVAGDNSRGRALRTAAACACAPLGMGLYLSFSRGALFACLAGLVTLVVVAPRRAQLRAMTVSCGAAVVAAVLAAPFSGVTRLSGSLSTRERQGAIVLVGLAVIIGVTGLVQWRVAARDPAGDIRLPRRAPWIALVLICAGLGVAIVAGAHEKAAQTLGAGAARLETLQSNRYAYWRVAVRAFRAQPIRGVGAGGWSVYWLRYRPFDEGAQDAHSLPLQTAAELGLIGLALLAMFLAGVGLAAADALPAAPALAAGPIAGFVVYVAHAPLDWDWEMPAVTLIAIVLAGLLIALSEGRAPSAAIAEANERERPVAEVRG
jgi:O-Antigen ligase